MGGSPGGRPSLGRPSTHRRDRRSRRRSLGPRNTRRQGRWSRRAVGREPAQSGSLESARPWAAEPVHRGRWSRRRHGPRNTRSRVGRVGATWVVGTRTVRVAAGIGAVVGRGAHESGAPESGAAVGRGAHAVRSAGIGAAVGRGAHAVRVAGIGAAVGRGARAVSDPRTATCPALDARAGAGNASLRLASSKSHSPTTTSADSAAANGTSAPSASPPLPHRERSQRLLQVRHPPFASVAKSVFRGPRSRAASLGPTRTTAAPGRAARREPVAPAERQEMARVDAELLDQLLKHLRRSQHRPLSPGAAAGLDRLQLGERRARSRA